MIKRLFLLLIATLTLTLVHARQISKQEAQQKAEQFFAKLNQNASNRKKAPRKAPKLVPASNREELFVFNDKANGGYVVISGDDRMPDVLAYSYDGLYDENDMPCNLKAWMDDYAGQVAYLRSHPEAKVKRQTPIERENIEPLLTCWFAQDSPFNNKCPEVDGKRCPTGCVATAMAQIMHYYQWPKQTTKIIPGYTTYAHKISMPEQPITTIDWDNIRDGLWNNYSDEEADAVSTLMLLCGTAVTMDYGPDDSGAGSPAKALRNYFDYDDLLESVSRDESDSDSWEEMIYEELMDRRPVYYSGHGHNYDDGHAFVMDGYEDGYFHVNLGWGGSHSYVLITEFYTYQSAVVGIRPADPDNPSRYAVCDNGKMTLYYDKEKTHRSGTVIPHKDDWSNYANEITECVIDPSFANLRQRSMEYYFKDLSQLMSIEGIENLKTDKVTSMYWMFGGCSSLTSLDLSSFKTDNVTDMSAMFYDCSSLTSLDLSGFNMDKVTNMSFMFGGCSSLTSLDLSGFKTDNVTDMHGMFARCSDLTSLDLSSFKTDNVTDMSAMFYDCYSLTSLDVSSFKTDNVTDMSAMFYDCSSLTSLDVSGFNTDNVTDMSRMFYACSCLTSLDLSSFKTDKVTDMSSMFSYCGNLKKIYVGAGWTTANVTSGDYMFVACSKLLGGAGTRYDGHQNYTYAHIDGGETNPGYFREKKPFEPYALLSEGNSLLTFYYDNQMESRGGMDVYERPWNSHSDDITDVVFDESFANCTTLTNTSSWFLGCSKLSSITGIGNLHTDNVTNMSNMFSGCSSLTSLDLGSFNTVNVTNMNSLFYNCKKLKYIYVGAKWTTTNVTSGTKLFTNCLKIVGGAGTKYHDVHTDYTYAHIDGGTTNPGYFREKNAPEPYAVLNADNTVQTFYCDNQMELRNGMDVYELQGKKDYSSKIRTVVFDESFANCTTLTSTSQWFQSFKNLENVTGIGNLHTGNVTDMHDMFDGCSSLTSLDLSGFKTDNVTDMHEMFYGCSSLTSLDLSSFNTDNVTNMSYMFYNCRNLKKIYVGAGWTTANVTSGSDMFRYCSHLVGGEGTRHNNVNDYTYAHIDGGITNPGYFRDKNLPDPSEPYAILSNDNTLLTFYYDNQMESRDGMDVYDFQWYFSHSGDITDVVFDESFANCTTLTETRYWFSNCSKLKSITGIDNLITDNVTNMYSMFCGCSSLTSLDLSNFNTDNVTSMGEMFRGCSSLTSLDLSGFKTDKVPNMEYMFSGCSSLTSLDLSGFKTDNVTNMQYMFDQCEKLKTIYVSEKWSMANVGRSYGMFYSCSELVGGEGTKYNSKNIDGAYAHIDGGESNPGYFTYKAPSLFTLTYIVDGEVYKTFSFVIGKDITPEPKPTKEGYVFLGWDEIPATMPDYDVVVSGAFYLYGDVNTDNDIDVLDVVDIARYVVKTPSESFVKQLADINNDDDVNLGDAVTLVNHIAGDQNLVKAFISPETTGNDMLTLKDKDGSFSLCLNNERLFTAFQFDLYVPEGADVTQMMLNAERKQRHQLLYNKVGDGHYRVAVLSTSNNEFNGNDGELLIIALNGVSGNEVNIRNIHFFDVRGNDYLLADIEGSTATSIRQIDNGELIIDNSIYDLQGRKRSALQRGVNIVGSKKVIVK